MARELTWDLECLILVCLGAYSLVMLWFSIGVAWREFKTSRQRRRR